MTASDLVLPDRDEGPYDLYVTLKWKTAPEVYDANGIPVADAWSRYPLDTVHGGLQIDSVRTWSGGIMYLGLPWEDAVRYERALRAARGGGILVPVAYRTPRISPAEGMVIARAEFERHREPDSVYGEFLGPIDEFCWWCYGAADYTAQAANVIPGVLYIFVHKLTGEIPSMGEIGKWFRAHAVE